MTIRNDLTMFWESSPRIIQIDAPSTEISMQDLIDTCSHLSAQAANIDDDILIESSGKEYLVEDGSVKVGLTVTLNNAKIAFEARSGPTWILCSIEGGNAVAVEDIYTTPRVYFDVRQPTAYTSVDRVSASSATLSEQAAIQYSSYNGGVSIDILSAYTGTDYPVGTPQAPVNNTSDALLIAVDKGFATFYIGGDITLNAGTDFEEMIFVGESKTKSLITIDDNADVENCEFYDAEITGILDGGNVLKNCLIGDINYVNGYIEQCVLTSGTVTLGGNKEAHFLDCWSGVVGEVTPTIDMGGSGQGLGLRNYNGGIKLTNKSGSEKISIDLNSGQVILDSTVSGTGEIVIRGIGKITDNSVGGNVNTEYLVNPGTITDAVWTENLGDHSGVSGSTAEALAQAAVASGTIEASVSEQDKLDIADRVWRENISTCTSGVGRVQQLQVFAGKVVIDVDNGFAGTSFPIGTNKKPSNNLTDALTIASGSGLSIISCRSDVTVTASHDISEMSVETHGIMGTDILFETGCSANNTTVKYANVSGEITLGDTLLLESCSIGTLENFTGIMNVATFAQGSEVSVGNWANFISCHAGGEPGNEPELNIGTGSVNINKYTGNLKLTGKTGTNRTVANFQSGNVIIDSTCVSGTIQILGIGAIEADNSGPNCKVDVDAAITKLTIAEAVWDEQLALHDNAGSPGAAFIGLTYDGKVCIDVSTSYSGIGYPIGSTLFPVNNLADAKTIAGINNIREFQLYSNMVIYNGEDIGNYIFQSEQDIDVVLTLVSGCTTYNSRFHHLILQGTFDGKSYIDHSTTLNISNYSGFVIDTIFMGNIGVVDHAVPSLFSLCGGGKTSTVVEIDLSNSSLNISGWKASAKLINKIGSGSNIVELMSGEIEVDSTCVSGSIVLKGVGRLIADNSGPGCTVDTTDLINRYVVADEVWDELTAGHSDAGSYGEWASDIADNIVRTLGLTQENYYLDNTTYTEYSGAKLLTGGRLRIYSVAGSVGTSNNVTATYQITSVWTGDELDTYKVVKQ